MADDITLKLGNLPQTEFSKPFMQGMLNRLAVGYHRYGPAKENASINDFIKSIDVRIAKYLETGNTEYLIDVANYAMLEFVAPSHPNAHFDPETAISPGVVRR